MEATLLETAIGEERPAEVADAEEGDGLRLVGAHDAADRAAHLVDVVATGDVAEGAEAGEVAAKLAGVTPTSSASS